MPKSILGKQRNCKRIWLVSGAILTFTLTIYGAWFTNDSELPFATNESQLILFGLQQLAFIGTISLTALRFGFIKAMFIWFLLVLITAPFAFMVISQTPEPHLILQMLITGFTGIALAWLITNYEGDKKSLQKQHLKLVESLELTIDELRREIVERRNQETFLKSILNNTHDGFWIIDTNGQIQNVNKAYCRMTGYTENELVGRSMSELGIVNNNESQLNTRLQNLMNNGLDIFETQHRKKDGAIIDLEVSNNLLRHGGTIYKFSFFRDITDRKAYQAVLTESLTAVAREAQEWQETFDSVMDIVTVISTDFRFLKINKSGCSAVGKEADELIGKKCYEVIHGTDRPIDSCPCLAALKSGKPGKSEVTDRGLTCLATASPIYDTHGQMIAFTHTLKDITDLKAAEREKEQLRNKAEMAGRLAVVGEMAAGIAHEINNPLTSVIGFAELLMQRPDIPDDMKEELRIINDGSLRVKEIVRRMLTFARQIKPARMTANITELIDNTLELRNYVLETANIKVVRDYNTDLPWISVDPGQIQQVFLNLIVNAEYAMKKANGKGTLTIKAERANNHIRVVVTDDGPGIPDEVKDKLFNPFFTTKDPGEGTGLGLPLSQGIIREHGGTLEVESTQGQGTSFIIELPIRLAVDENAVLEPVTEDKTTAVPPARVLVIDDEPAVRSLMQNILTMDGHHVQLCASPQEAMALLNGETYDLVFSDVRMPGMSGMELHQLMIQTQPEMRGKIAFMTGDTSDTVTREYLQTNNVPYITKPFNRKTLIDKVRQLL
jgi:PAS domain S-box-containing protein